MTSESPLIPHLRAKLEEWRKKANTAYDTSAPGFDRAREHYGEWYAYSDCIRSIEALLANHEAKPQPMCCHHCGWEGPYRDIVQAGLNNEVCPRCQEPAHPVEGYPAAHEAATPAAQAQEPAIAMQAHLDRGHGLCPRTDPCYRECECGATFWCPAEAATPAARYATDEEFKTSADRVLKKHDASLRKLASAEAAPVERPELAAETELAFLRMRDAHADEVILARNQRLSEIAVESDRLRAALVGLVGVDGREELEQMEATLRSMPVPAEDKVAAINGIHALISTLPALPPSTERTR